MLSLAGFYGSAASFDAKNSFMDAIMVVTIVGVGCGWMEQHYEFHRARDESPDLFFGGLAVLVVLYLGFGGFGGGFRRTSIGTDVTDEIKGIGQAFLLLYHYSGFRGGYGVARLAQGMFVFLLGFGHWMSWRRSPGDVIQRWRRMFFRIVFPGVILAIFCGNWLILYYFVPLAVVFVSECWMFGMLGQSVGWKLALGLWMVVNSLVLVPWIREVVFRGVGVLGKFWEHELAFRVTLDVMAPVWGALTAEWILERGGVLDTWTQRAIAVVGVVGGLVYCFVEKEDLVVWVHPLFGPLVVFALVQCRMQAVEWPVNRLFVWIGKRSFGLYLLQHHLFLVENAKAILSFAPEWPIISFVVGTVVFMGVVEVFSRALESIRFVSVEDAVDGFVGLAMSYLSRGVGGFLQLLFGVVVGGSVVWWRDRWEMIWSRVLMLVVVGGMVSMYFEVGGNRDRDCCHRPGGMWRRNVFVWDAPTRKCGGRSLRDFEVRLWAEEYKPQFVGDSNARNLFRVLAQRLDQDLPSYAGHCSRHIEHASFLWAPFSSNLSSPLPQSSCPDMPSTLPPPPSSQNIQIFSLGWWDILHHQNTTINISTSSVFVTVPMVVSNKLPTSEKRASMTPQQAIILSNSMPPQQRIVNFTAMTIPRSAFTADGIHYSDLEYNAALEAVILSTTNCSLPRPGHSASSNTLPGTPTLPLWSAALFLFVVWFLF